MHLNRPLFAREPSRRASHLSSRKLGAILFTLPNEQHLRLSALISGYSSQPLSLQEFELMHYMHADFLNVRLNQYSRSVC